MHTYVQTDRQAGRLADRHARAHASIHAYILTDVHTCKLACSIHAYMHAPKHSHVRTYMHTDRYCMQTCLHTCPHTCSRVPGPHAPPPPADWAAALPPIPYGTPPLPCAESGNLRSSFLHQKLHYNAYLSRLYGDGDGGRYSFDDNDDVEQDVKDDRIVDSRAAQHHEQYHRATASRKIKTTAKELQERRMRAARP